MAGGIYERMKTDWETYCLMSAIAYIEEMSKPTKHIEIKRYKTKKYFCKGFHSVRLKMKNEEIVKRFLKITQHWERKKHLKLVGKSFNLPKKDKSGQDVVYFTPVWLNEIISTCGSIPNKYSLSTATERIENLKQYSAKAIDLKKNLFSELKTDKKIAAGAFIVSMDFECRGIQAGRISLCMSEKYEDFLNTMLGIAKTWKWTHNKKLSTVDVSHSKALGIKASSQYELRLSMNGLKEIYSLAGPLLDPFKDKCIRFHIQRSKEYKNKGHYLLLNRTRQKILDLLCSGTGGMSTTSIMFDAGVGTDVILDHLNKLEQEGKVYKQRSGKRYLWSAIKNDY
ncbi:MAG: winged helix-turn-helix transcriptional regulator [Candidatus Diapherotrites archaeon]|nr:winged helix-turn-helix transcriptional regulator [Candidatus Diapherotrites archaeon]